MSLPATAALTHTVQGDTETRPPPRVPQAVSSRAWAHLGHLKVEESEIIVPHFTGELNFNSVMNGGRLFLATGKSGNLGKRPPGVTVPLGAAAGGRGPFPDAFWPRPALAR